MFCKECGSPMNDTDLFCTNCGHRVQPEEPAQQEEPVKAEEPAQQEEPIKKKSALPLVLGAIAVVIVAVAVVCVLNAKAMSNFFHKTFNSPEDYYRWVEAQSVKDTAELTGTLYNSFLNSVFKLYDTNVSGEVGFELGKEGSELLSLAGLAGVDLSWIRDGALSFGYNAKDDKQSMDLGLSLNQNQIVSAQMILDIKGMMLYAKVPELSKTWLAFGEDVTGFDEEEMEEYLETIEKLQDYGDKFPSQEQVTDLMERYCNAILECVDDVDMDTVTIEAEDVEQKCTALEIKIDRKVAGKMVKNVCKTAEKDKDLEKIIKNLAEIADEEENPEDVYDEFLDSLDETLERLEDMDEDEDEGGEIRMTVYVNSKGEIIGRAFEIEDKYGDITKISTIMPQKGKNFGYEANFEYEDGKGKLTGSGTRVKDKLSGDFAVKYNGTGIVDIQVTDFDMATARKGYINGSFSIRPNKALAKLLNLADYDSGFSLSWLQDLKVDILLEETENSNKIRVGVMLDQDDLGAVMISSTVEKGESVKVPDDAVEMEDDSDLMDYLEEADWDKFLSNLEKSKMPSEMIDKIEEYLDMLEYYY